MKCDLCRYAEAAVSPQNILCEACAAVISRLITIEHWMKHRLEDAFRNKLQEQLLVDYLKQNGKTQKANA